MPAAIPSPIPTTLIVEVLAFGVEFDVTPEGAIVTRRLSVGGNPVAGPDDLSLVEAPQSETFALSCTAQAGDAVDYELDPDDWTPDATATQQTKIRIINTGPFGVGEAFEYTTVDIGPVQVSNSNFELSGSGFATAMGPLLANNISPTIAPFGTLRARREARSSSRRARPPSARSTHTSGSSPTGRRPSGPRLSGPSRTATSSTAGS